MSDITLEEIRELWTKIEGYTGSQQTDAILILAAILKQGIDRIEETLNNIEDKLDDIDGSL